MEYRIKKEIIFLCCLVLFGCGYFENDRTDYEIKVSGNINIEKQENSKTVQLVFHETDEIGAVILNDCIEIYYDKSKEEIFVVTKVNEFIKKYYEIVIKNDRANSISDAVLKKEITEVDFNSRTSNKKSLVEWRYNKSS